MQLIMFCIKMEAPPNVQKAFSFQTTTTEKKKKRQEKETIELYCNTN